METRWMAEHLASEVAKKAAEVKTIDSYYSYHEREENLTKNWKFSFFHWKFGNFCWDMDNNGI